MVFVNSCVLDLILLILLSWRCLGISEPSTKNKTSVLHEVSSDATAEVVTETSSTGSTTAVMTEPPTAFSPAAFSGTPTWTPLDMPASLSEDMPAATTPAWTPPHMTATFSKDKPAATTPAWTPPHMTATFSKDKPPATTTAWTPPHMTATFSKDKPAATTPANTESLKPLDVKALVELAGECGQFKSTMVSKCEEWLCSRDASCGHQVIINSGTERSIACHCDALCLVYGDCCRDFNQSCHSHAKKAEEMYSHLLVREKTCEGTILSRYLVISDCPDNNLVQQVVPGHLKDPIVTDLLTGVQYSNRSVAECNALNGSTQILVEWHYIHRADVEAELSEVRQLLQNGTLSESLAKSISPYPLPGIKARQCEAMTWLICEECRAHTASLSHICIFLDNDEIPLTLVDSTPHLIDAPDSNSTSPLSPLQNISTTAAPEQIFYRDSCMFQELSSRDIWFTFMFSSLFSLSGQKYFKKEIEDFSTYQLVTCTAESDNMCSLQVTCQNGKYSDVEGHCIQVSSIQIYAVFDTHNVETTELFLMFLFEELHDLLFEFLLIPAGEKFYSKDEGLLVVTEFNLTNLFQSSASDLYGPVDDKLKTFLESLKGLPWSPNEFFICLRFTKAIGYERQSEVDEENCKWLQRREPLASGFQCSGDNCPAGNYQGHKNGLPRQTAITALVLFIVVTLSFFTLLRW